MRGGTRTGSIASLGLRSGPSLRGRLFALAGLLALAMAGLAGIAVLEARGAARDRAAGQLLGTTRILARVVDHEFGEVEALLLGLGTSPALDPLQPAVFLAQAEQVLDRLGGGPILLLGADGRLLWSTAVPPAVPTAGPPGLLAALGTGRLAISDLLAGPAPRAVSIALGVPLRRPAGDAAAGAMPAVLGAYLPPTLLAEALAGQWLPQDWVAAVLDRRSGIVARTMQGAEILSGPAMEEVRAGLAGAAEGILPRLRTQDGTRHVVAFARAPRSGYAVLVQVPEAGFGGAWQAALLRAGMLGLVLALAGFALAGLLAQRIAQGLRALGERMPAPPGFRELDELAGRLAASAQQRDAAAAALHDRNEWLEASQRAAQVGTWDWDLGTGVQRWSDQQFRLHGLEPAAPGEVGPETWHACIHPEDLAQVIVAGQEALRTGSLDTEFRVRHPDGSIRWLASRAVLERDAEARPRRLLGLDIDITDYRVLQAEREKLLRMKDLVVLEMHHRVKNSLQLLHGMLLMQARSVPPDAAARLREGAARVLIVAALHRRLYEEEAEQGTDLATYLTGLMQDLRGSLLGATPGRSIELRIEPGFRLAVSQLAPFGLVVAELVTNALKYGAGPVVVICRHGPEGMELAVQDDGPGFPAEFDPGRARGLGMRLSLALVRHHHGRLEIDRAAPGGRVVLTLPEAPGSGLSYAAPSPAVPAASS
ncbi:sensor histidine kinase [Siccirubricoccus sp. G192]|uniref:sensor histidine kinase n=1 Tax=Siccirubricoccus sp. G192 TaxID=2849651 RepID=UPI001C2C0199|nr:PAS domain-containing protein [Siccirubricoccus sp. G192]MBV1796205.1 PAS domain-containing protein [Siccirubricoccus sp. G192]